MAANPESVMTIDQILAHIKNMLSDRSKIKVLLEKLAEKLKTDHLLDQNQQCITLDLSSLNLDDEQILLLIPGLKENQTVISLNLFNNKITDCGAIGIAEVLANNVTLKFLDLNTNKIGNSGAKAISDSLLNNTTLTSLDLEENPIHREGILSFWFSLVTKNRTLIELKFRTIEDTFLKLMLQKITLFLERNSGKKKVVPVLDNSLTTSFKLSTESTDSLPSAFDIPLKSITFDKEIGRGAFAIVYKGIWQYHPVAIKKIFSHQPHILSSLQEEIRQMLQLRHPNIVSLYGFCSSIGNECIVMELCEQGSLDTYLKKHPSLQWGAKYKITLDIIFGIHHLHSKNILHRDIKPQNVLIDRQTNAKVTDFNLATSNLNSTALVGTPLYMPPETLTQKGSYSTAGDIYSFAIVCSYMASEEEPYPHVKTRTELIEQLNKGVRPTVPPKTTPPDFYTVMTKMWDQIPKNRPSTEEAIESIKACKNNYEEFIRSLSVDKN